MKSNTDKKSPVTADKKGLLKALKENALAWELAQSLSRIYAEREPLTRQGSLHAV
jgi:hypothetical protein